MDNAEVARAFSEIADLLEIKGANPFRIRAYRSAARSIENSPSALLTLWNEGGSAALEKLRGIGRDLAAKIAELLSSGELAMLVELRAEIPPGVVAFTRIPGLGPKRAGRIWRELGVATLEGLEAAAQDGRVDELAGFGPAMAKKIVAGIGQVRAFSERVRIDEAEAAVAPLLERLGQARGVLRVEVCGSLRRRRETIGDIDLLAVATEENDGPEALLSAPGVEEVIARGPAKTSVRLGGGLQVDLRLVPPESAGAALQYFSGSKEHNIALRAIAQRSKLTLNENGLFDGEDRVAGRTEAEVYSALGLCWIPPELRHGSGEIDAAAKGTLPELVSVEEIRGDLQMHTTASDGRHTLEEMVRACLERGYEYMAVTDHGPSVRVANGLSPERFRAQYDQIRDLQQRIDGLRILRSAEVDILAGGELDLPDDLLEEMDVVLVSVHSKFNMTEAEMTNRIGLALKHPRVKILGHPTGRLINRRDPYPLDMAEIIRIAAGEGVLLECNAHPERLDLRDVHMAAARDAGVPIVISTDAHRVDDLGMMRYGVEQARRAGLQRSDVANARPLAEFLELIGA